ncbi:DUF1707 and DUF4870 domain-containing protein [Propionibacterium freudenreichii]|nr:DUF1707 and DUF4870 domain-containing protein [Propionibacterium freudenreichii]PWM99303.1 MAG: DUF1707 domain-containing protein [Propionibacterium sp.]ARO11848.1 hypothetical protein BMR99_04320 [Propionibacterium freudenreichii]MCQ1997221.1 DUF1707 domain-containing protein [Propionibacterium freudenreichii]MCT3004086.1 DUF1707 and DUF4870 domain-containing protein [Propionibacterium freudenreichii]MCT3007226.1 DUF1707 and DUF4870 domain-containing protein [Propionibacterium freudenreich
MPMPSGSPIPGFTPESFGAAGRDLLDAPITEEQRQRSERYLQDAYAEGRLSHEEFGRRIDKVLRARTRRELNAALEGFVKAGLASQVVGQFGAYPSVVVPREVRRRAGRWAGAAAHWSGAFTWIVGPAAVYALSKPHSYPHREAAKAFNTQIAIAIVSALVVGFSALLGLGWIPFAVWSALALVLIVVSGLNASDGKDSRNVLQRVLPIRVLDEK